MEPTVFILLAIWLLLLVLNTVATVVILKTYFIVKARRYWQLLFVWLLPFFGAIMAIYINREEQFHSNTRSNVGNNPHISESKAVTFGAATQQFDDH